MKLYAGQQCFCAQCGLALSLEWDHENHKPVLFHPNGPNPECANKKYEVPVIELKEIKQ